MTINQLSTPSPSSAASGPAARTARTAHVRHLLTFPGIVGVGYALSWIAGLSVPAPSPRFSASGSEIVTALAGHGTSVALQFALTEGLPAAGIAVITVTLARAARSRGAARASEVALISGMAAAVISLLQFVIGMALVATTAPATAHLLFQAVDRMDGVKMLALAVLGAAGASASGRAGTAVLPRWLRYSGAALAVSIAASGVVYLLLLENLAFLAGPALIALLVFVAGTGITLGRANRA